MNKLLDLIRRRRKFEYRTLDGHRPSDKQVYWLLSTEIELEMEEIGRKNKTILKKEAKGNPFLEARLKRGELN